MKSVSEEAEEEMVKVLLFDSLPLCGKSDPVN